jgi:PIN domain nuclease of toxin-antitoxin system
VNLLLDTQVLLWALNGDKALSSSMEFALRDPGNVLNYSVVSIWEAAIKLAKGNLQMPGNSVASLYRHAEENGISILPIRREHLLTLEKLPMLHRDPFDRLIIAQARAEHMRLVSADGLIYQYEPDAIR